MQHNEYERRRRGIEEQLQADLELIRAGHQAKLRALELLWLASSGEERLDDTSVTLASAETQTTLKTPPSVTQPEPEDTAAPPAPILPQARRRGDILADILSTFPHLPEVFDRSHVVHLLGYAPSRPSLHRAWSQLLEEKKVVVERYADGPKPQIFRKVRGE